MIITTVETYWKLEINWGWSDIGYTGSHTSIHKLKANAELRAYRVIRETTCLAGSAIHTICIAERESGSYADLKAGTTEFSYSITAVEVEE